MSSLSTQWKEAFMRASIAACVEGLDRPKQWNDYILVIGLMNEWMDRWIGWMNGWMNGWMDGWMDGWMNEWMNELIN